MRTWLLAAFAASALALLCAGIDGTLNQAISLRRREAAASGGWWGVIRVGQDFSAALGPARTRPSRPRSANARHRRTVHSQSERTTAHHLLRRQVRTVTSEPPSVDWMPRWIGSLAAVAGGLVLLAWGFDLETVKGPLQGGATMKVNTALCFILAGAALATMSARGVPSRAGSGLALAGVAIAVATLVEYALSWDLHIDQLLIVDADPTSSPPGRMSPMTALCFTTFGLAISVSRTPERLWLREPLAIVALLASAVATLGYTYDTQALYSAGPYTSMAPHTALLITLMAIGLLSQHPAGGGLSGVVLGRDLGGATARRLLPWALATPLVVGWVRLQGQRAGLWGPELGVAAVVIATMVIVSTVVLANARSLRASERTERAAVAELRELTHTLERRVEEKTRALSEREHHLRAVIDHAQDAFMAIDDTGTIVDWNPRAVATFGWLRDEAVGLPAVALLVPEGERLSVQQGLEQAFVTPPHAAFSRRIETIALHRDGHEIPVEASLSLVKSSPGWRLNAFVRDLTTSKQSEARFRALLESAPDAMVITDEAGVVTLANQQAERLFGYSREEFVGLGVDILLPPRFRAGHAVHRRAYSADPQSRAMGIGLDLRVSPGLARLTKSPTLSTRRTPVPGGWWRWCKRESADQRPSLLKTNRDETLLRSAR